MTEPILLAIFPNPTTNPNAIFHLPILDIVIVVDDGGTEAQARQGKA